MREVLEVNPAVLERYFRARERELEPRVSPPYVVRMDGVGFGRALADLPGPRDRRVHTALVEAAARLVRTYGACGAFVVSDEVSVFFDTSNPYGGRVEKLSSILASMLASLVSLSLGRALYFDGRVVPLRDYDDALMYLYLRARIGLNNFVGRWLRMLGIDPGDAGLGDRIAMLREAGIDVEAQPRWATLGTSILWARGPGVGRTMVTGDGYEALSSYFLERARGGGG